MQRSLLANLLVAELALAGCWATHAPAPDRPQTPSAPATSTPSDTNTCRETGDRLALVVCRQNDDLAWRVTNNTDVTLWVFVAPPSIHAGKRARENAFVEARGGKVVLHKFQLPEKTAEPIMTGAIALSPGASDSGVVPLGKDLAPDAHNMWGIPRPARQSIRSVTLEVGFAKRQPTDLPDADKEFSIFSAFDKARQELVRSPELPW